MNQAASQSGDRRDGGRAAVDAELLAPAGDMDCVRAAVENGADAVYFGLQEGFNARGRATNVPSDQLPATMTFLHRRGVRGYVTLNILAFPAELPMVEQTVRTLVDAGVDAVLVQDLGVLQLVRAVCPDLPVHASTQMSLTSAQGIDVVAQLGVQRAVLARELSVEEIRSIGRQTRVPLEVFVHGALCVAYSGQCLTSESLGGRSANRGICAQACRLPYEMICDGRPIDLGPQQYLLSPQDLAAYALLPELLDAGVSSFKIEGRMKTADYVANITKHYREALDTALAGRPVQFTARQEEEMELSFSRGFSPGWLRGCDHKLLVPGLSSAKRGVLLGEVVRAGGGRVEVALQRSIKPGDGIVFEGDRAKDEEQGGRVYEIFRGGRRITEPAKGGKVELAFRHDSIDFQRLWVGQKIWKTDDPELTRRLRKTYSGPDPRRRTPLTIHVQASVGQPLHATCRAGGEWICEVTSDQPLQAATKHRADIELLRTQLGRLGGTPFVLERLTADIDGDPMIPLSVLGRLRKEIVSRVGAAAARRPARHVAPEPMLVRLRAENEQQMPAHDQAAADAPPQLRVLCRSLSQVQAAVACDVRGVVVDFQDIRGYREAVRLAHAAGAEIFLATPQIQKPRELGIFRVLLRHGADGIVARNLAGLDFFVGHDVPVVADHTLNAANDLAVHYLRRQGAGRVVASFDLNRDQLLDLVGAIPTSWLEVVIHQHMPLFHMEHCVFCAVLSPGTNKTNCGRPCDRHAVHLRDRVGMEHRLVADVGCRNTLLNATAQSAAEAVPRLLAAGVRNFRIDLLDEDESQLRRLLGLYRDLLAGRIPGREVWRRLKASNRVGVTRGTLEQRRDPLAIL